MGISLLVKGHLHIETVPSLSVAVLCRGSIWLGCQTMHSWYLKVSFLQRTLKRRPIARPSGRDMGSLFWVHSLRKALAFFLSWCVKYRIIFDHYISRVYDIQLNVAYNHYVLRPVIALNVNCWNNKVSNCALITQLFLVMDDVSMILCVCFYSCLMLLMRRKKHHSDTTWESLRLKSPVTQLFVQMPTKYSGKHQSPTILALSMGNPPVTVGFCHTLDS